MRGNNLQLQREVADLRAQGEPGEAADPADPTDPADPAEMEEQDEREEQEVIVTNMPPPPAREPGTGTSRDVRLFLMKEDVRSWMNPDHAKRWFITTTRPATVSLTQAAMASMMHATVHVTKDVREMLNNLGGFDVREFIAPGDERDVTDRLLTENLAIFNRAVVKLLSKGVYSSVGRARVAIIQQGLQSGLHLLEQHCNECRRQMRVHRANLDSAFGLHRRRGTPPLAAPATPGEVRAAGIRAGKIIRSYDLGQEGLLLRVGVPGGLCPIRQRVLVGARPRSQPKWQGEKRGPLEQQAWRQQHLRRGIVRGPAERC